MVDNDTDNDIADIDINEIEKICTNDAYSDMHF